MNTRDSALSYICGLALLATLVSVGLVVATNNLPDPVSPEDTCSCNGDPECTVAVFLVNDDQRAYCALFGRYESCCIEGANRAVE